MRPCPKCGAALENHARNCSHCGAEMVPSTWDGPPPETGPGVSGDPAEERAVMIGLFVVPACLGIIAAIVAINIWGPLGLLIGLLIGVAAFAVRLALY